MLVERASISDLDQAARIRLRQALPSLAQTTEASSGFVTFEGKCYRLGELQAASNGKTSRLLQEAK